MADYEYLSASNGSGDAAKMNIQTDRTAGATLIDVDSVTNVPTKFIGTWGTVGADGKITLASKRDFKGRVSGADIIIDGMEPGSVDNGNTIGQVIIIKPNTGWSNRVAQAVMAVHPVNSIYIETSGVNPATTFGFGTWVAFGAGRVLIGSGTSDRPFVAGATGGESSHVLTTAEMASHNHTMTTFMAGATSVLSQNDGSNDSILSTDNALQGNNGNYIMAGNQYVKYTDSTGSGTAHNVLQPYVVVYMWQRTA